MKSKIIWIVGSLIFVGILQIFWGIYIFRYYNRQNEQLESHIGEAFLTEQDSRFYYLNMQMQTLLYDGSEFQRVEEAYGQTLDLPAVIFEQTNSVLDVKSMFQGLSNAYGSELQFIYYNPQTQKRIEYGGMDISERSEVVSDILHDVETENVAFPKNGKWQLYDGKYLCMLNHGKQGYAACFMTAESFAEQVMKMIPEGSARVEICDKNSGATFVEERDSNGEMQFFLLEEEPGEEGWRNMKYADFKVRIQLMENYFTKPIMIQLAFILIFVIYLMVVFFVLVYTKQNILGQVNLFHENLLQFADKMQIQGESGIVEFAEAGKVLNQLADEINRLKIDVYEEQLERKKVELDYAQLQIRPHFYTNCLSVIDSFAEMGKTEEIKKLSILVSNYLRGTFRKSMKPVPLSEELKFVRNYLEVFDCMNGVECHLELFVDEGLENFELPPLMIQTFVENAIKYGFEDEDFFELQIRVERVCENGETVVKIIVRDFGRGIEVETCDLWNQGKFDIEDERYHIGIRNAVQRMQMMYGDRAGIYFTSQEGEGMEVTIFFAEQQGGLEHENIIGG